MSNGGDLTTADVYNDFAFVNGVDSPQSMTMTLSGDGIAADAEYLLTFYSLDSHETQGMPSVTYAGTAGTSGSAGPLSYTPVVPVSDDQYAVTGTFTSDGAGVLTIDMTDMFTGETASTGIRLNAFEIAIPGDFNEDGEVNRKDVVDIVAAYGDSANLTNLALTQKHFVDVAPDPNPAPAAVPEPSTLMLFAVALMAWTFVGRRRKK